MKKLGGHKGSHAKVIMTNPFGLAVRFFAMALIILLIVGLPYTFDVNLAEKVSVLRSSA